MGAMKKRQKIWAAALIAAIAGIFLICQNTNDPLAPLVPYATQDYSDYYSGNWLAENIPSTPAPELVPTIYRTLKVKNMTASKLVETLQASLESHREWIRHDHPSDPSVIFEAHELRSGEFDSLTRPTIVAYRWRGGFEVIEIRPLSLPEVILLNIRSLFRNPYRHPHGSFGAG